MKIVPAHLTHNLIGADAGALPKDLTMTTVGPHPPNTPPPEYLTDRSGAAMLAISRATWWRRVRDGTLPKSVKIGGATRWRRADVLAAIARLSSAAV